jgi:hypothetical protein
MKTFKIVMRGPSALVFQERNGLRIDEFPTKAGAVCIVYASRWINNSDGVRIPGDIWIEVSGPGENLDEVLTRFANAGISVLPVLSLAFNAAIHEPEIEIGFESTADANEREYFQSYLSPERTIAHVSRLARADLALSTIQAMFKHSDAERLLRAANQYRLALESWRLGRESLSTAHLWMAIEALTKVQMRRSMAEMEATTPQDLAKKMGVDLKQLDATLRKERILNGDYECYSKAKEASDGFEHGYLGYDKIREHAEFIRYNLAKHVRGSILRLAGVAEPTVNQLNRSPFDKPVGYWPLAKYLRGKLVGASKELAAAGNEYPFIKWNPIVTACSVSDSEIKMTTKETFTAELAEGIGYDQQSYEVWQPG